MQHRSIGSLSVSAIGLGCNQLGTRCDQPTSSAIVHRALDLGVTLFDTAEEYGDGASEHMLGVALQGRRHHAVIATKFGGFRQGLFAPGRAGAAAIVAALEASLQRLGTDHVDLYQLHFPDPQTPLDETLAALDTLVRSGKVREIGCCNLGADQIDTAGQIADTRGLRKFAVAQNRFNLLRQEAADALLPACARHGMAFLPYFPLAAGLLTGKYRTGEPPAADTRLGGDFVSPEVASRVLKPEALARVARLQAFAAARGGSVTQLALAWLLAQPGVASVIAGATSAGQLDINATALGMKLTQPDAAAAAAIGQGAAPRA